MQKTENSIISGNSKPVIELLGIGVLLLVVIGFFYPMLFGGKVIFYRDFNLITYPIRYFLGQTFNEGAIPFWVPHANGGMPFMAAFHPGVFYPPSLLLFLNDTTYALNLFYVLHFMVLGVFTYLLARSWDLSFVAALCCGVTGMLSGFALASTLLSNFFMAGVWLPMVFWMFHKFWTEKHIGYFVGLVLTIATQTLAACPEISIMTMLLLYAHSLYFLPRAPGYSGIARMTASLGLAVILALGLSAFQLVPTAKLIGHSERDGGLDYRKHTGWSLEPAKLLSFALSPDYNEFLDSELPARPSPDSSLNTQGHPPPMVIGFLHTLYMGLLGLIFIFFGFFFRREKAVGFWLVIFLFGIFLALGKYNPLYKLIYYGLPFLNLFRYPEKYIYISSFAVVFLTGYGLDILIRYTRDQKIRIFRVLMILIFLFGLFSLLAVWKPSLNPEYSMAFLAIFGVAYILFYFGKMKETWFAALVLLIIFVDLSIKGKQFLPLIDRKYYEEKPLLTNITNDAFGKHRIYSGKLKDTPDPLQYPNGPTRLAGVIASKEHLYPYFGMIYGLEHVNGWPGLALELKKNILWLRVFLKSQPERRERILMRSNVKYWIDGDQPTAYQGGYPVILPDRVKILKDALPRAYLVPRARKPKENGHLLNTYYAESFDPLKEVLLNQEVDFKESVTFKGEVEQVVYRPNQVTVKTFQEGNGFLVLMDSYFPGWTVRVDGQEQSILQANHYYRAVQLDSGRHTLEFHFAPEGMKAGLIISGFSLFLIVFGVLFGKKYLKRVI
jgi:hypothetical protein